MFEQCMKNLREELLKKMGEENITLTELSIRCDVSCRRMSDIVNGEARNISFSTFVSICENADLSYINIFGISNKALFEAELKTLVVTDGKNRYKLHKV